MEVTQVRGKALPRHVTLRTSPSANKRSDLGSKCFTQRPFYSNIRHSFRSLLSHCTADRIFPQTAFLRLMRRFATESYDFITSLILPDSPP